MTATTSALIAMGVLAFSAAIRLPIAFGLGAAGFVGITLLDGLHLATNTLARVPFGVPSRYVLIVVPMFIAMGIFAKDSGLAEGAFRAAQRRVGRVPGGLALGTLGACAGFAAVSGSSVATVVSVGKLSIDEMTRHGYRPSWAAAVVASSGTLGVLIPPSIVLVIYGIITGESIGSLLLAGILPGILSAILYAGLIIYRDTGYGSTRTFGRSVKAGPHVDDPDLVTGSSTESSPTSTGSMRSDSSFAPNIPPAVVWIEVAILFAAVIGGIYGGIFTATESSAVGAVLALLLLCINSALYPASVPGKFTEVLSNSFREIIGLTTMIFFLLIGAGLFTQFIVLAAIPRRVAESVASMSIAPLLVTALLLLLFIPLGMFLDSLSLMLIAVPIAYPLVVGFGFSGIWFGILVVKAIEVGLITPPLGLNVYAVAGVSPQVEVESVFGQIGWFVLVDALTIVFIFMVPSISLWLPASAG